MMEKINLLYEEQGSYLIEEIRRRDAVIHIGEEEWNKAIMKDVGELFDDINVDVEEWYDACNLSRHCRDSDPVPDVRPIRLVPETDLKKVKDLCEEYNVMYRKFIESKKKLKDKIEQP